MEKISFFGSILTLFFVTFLFGGIVFAQTTPTPTPTSCGAGSGKGVAYVCVFNTGISPKKITIQTGTAVIFRNESSKKMQIRYGSKGMSRPVAGRVEHRMAPYYSPTTITYTNEVTGEKGTIEVLTTQKYQAYEKSQRQVSSPPAPVAPQPPKQQVIASPKSGGATTLPPTQQQKGSLTSFLPKPKTSSRSVQSTFEVPWPFKEGQIVFQNGSIEDKLDIVFVGTKDYTLKELVARAKDVGEKGFQMYSPFRENWSRINIWAVTSDIDPGSFPSHTSSDFIASIEEGWGAATTIPALSFLATSAKIGLADGDSFFILSKRNTATYAPWGGNVAFVTEGHYSWTHAAFAPYLLHEFGHSFGDLRDEYDADPTRFFLSPAEPNCIPKVVAPWDFERLKNLVAGWRDQSGKEDKAYSRIGLVALKKGAFDGCSNSKDAIRPTDTSMMRDMVGPFNYVSRGQLEAKLSKYKGDSNFRCGDDGQRACGVSSNNKLIIDTFDGTLCYPGLLFVKEDGKSMCRKNCPDGTNYDKESLACAQCGTKGQTACEEWSQARPLGCYSPLQSHPTTHICTECGKIGMRSCFFTEERGFKGISKDGCYDGLVNTYHDLVERCIFPECAKTINENLEKSCKELTEKYEQCRKEAIKNKTCQCPKDTKVLHGVCVSCGGVNELACDNLTSAGYVDGCKERKSTEKLFINSASFWAPENCGRWYKKPSEDYVQCRDKKYREGICIEACGHLGQVACPLQFSIPGTEKGCATGEGLENDGIAKWCFAQASLSLQEQKKCADNAIQKALCLKKCPIQGHRWNGTACQPCGGRGESACSDVSADISMVRGCKPGTISSVATIGDLTHTKCLPCGSAGDRACPKENASSDMVSGCVKGTMPDKEMCVGCGQIGLRACRPFAHSTSKMTQGCVFGLTPDAEGFCRACGELNYKACPKTEGASGMIQGCKFGLANDNGYCVECGHLSEIACPHQLKDCGSKGLPKCPDQLHSINEQVGTGEYTLVGGCYVKDQLVATSKNGKLVCDWCPFGKNFIYTSIYKPNSGTSCVACGSISESACPRFMALDVGAPYRMVEGCKVGGVNKNGICVVCGGLGQHACLGQECTKIRCSSTWSFCSQGATAIKDVCQPCGDYGQQACPKGAETKDMVDGCVRGAISNRNKCVSCGDRNQKACPARNTPSWMINGCKESTVNQKGVCIKCGDEGETACPHTTVVRPDGCTTGTMKVASGKCAVCGKLNKNACSGKNATDSMINGCEQGSANTKGLCAACGMKGQLACPGVKGGFWVNGCNAPFINTSGVCQSCSSGFYDNGGCISCGQLNQPTCPSSVTRWEPGLTEGCLAPFVPGPSGRSMILVCKQCELGTTYTKGSNGKASCAASKSKPPKVFR